jgi:antitoxin component YwqK of YwqJK toxin-antitoxin module
MAKTEKTSNSGLRVNYDETEDVENITHYKGNPFTGICYRLYENGNLQEEFELLKGLKHGNFKKYFEDGQIQLEGEFKDGNRDGNSKEFYENGGIKIEITAVDTKNPETYHEVSYKTYFENGKLYEDFNIVNGEIHGDSKMYYENGVLRLEGKMKNGKRDGQIIYYRQETTLMEKSLGFGTKEKVEFYKNGILDGPSMRYDEDGNYIDTTMYKNGEIEFKKSKSSSKGYSKIRVNRGGPGIEAILKESLSGKTNPSQKNKIHKKDKKCNKCMEESPSTFDTCWKCGSSFKNLSHL